MIDLVIYAHWLQDEVYQHKDVKGRVNMRPFDVVVHKDIVLMRFGMN